MAPRRPVTRGERRIDAALDAMAPYGFSTKLVHQTVAQLLKVYGGNEGWIFIEDSAYTLLIDTLLEQQQTLPLPQPQDCLIEEDNAGNGPNEASPAGGSNIALQPCSNPENLEDAASATSETVNELPIKPIDTSYETCSKLRNQPSIKAVVDTISATGENDLNQVPIKARDTAVLADNESEPPQSSQPMERVCRKRRKPYHGWISNDDDEEVELIELPAKYKLPAMYYVRSRREL